MRNLKIGKTKINIEAVSAMSKEEFQKAFADTNLFDVESAWNQVQSHIKSEKEAEKEEKGS